MRTNSIRCAELTTEVGRSVSRMGFTSAANLKEHGVVQVARSNGEDLATGEGLEEALRGTASPTETANIGYVLSSRYMTLNRETVNELVSFMNGNTSKVTRELTQCMEEAA